MTYVNAANAGYGEGRPSSSVVDSSIGPISLNDGTHIAVNFSPLKKHHAVCVSMQTAYVFDGAR